MLALGRQTIDCFIQAPYFFTRKHIVHWSLHIREREILKLLKRYLLITLCPAAGKNAANYIKNGEEKDAKIVEILPVDGVRYTVPKYIRPTEMDDTLTVRFRVGAVYKNCAIATYFDDQLISKRKRPVMAPGEMEQVILDKKKLNEHPDLSKITIKIEEA